MQETESDVAPADEPGEEEMTFEMQLPPRGAQQARFEAAPNPIAASAAEVAKSQVESNRNSKHDVQHNVQKKFKSPPLTSLATPSKNPPYQKQKTQLAS